MNKKRIFTGIAAFITALTMGLTLAACSGNNNTSGGDDSVLTENQWVQAWADTLAATNFKYVEKSDVVGKIEDFFDDGLIDVDSKYKLELFYDGAGLKVYSIMKDRFQLGTKDYGESTAELYTEVSDRTINKFVYQNDKWKVDIEEYDTTGEARENLRNYQSYGSLTNLTKLQLKRTGENEEVTDTLDRLYSLFSYNGKTHVYSATLNAVNYYQIFERESDDVVRDCVEMTLQISFKNGKVYNVIADYVCGKGEAVKTNHMEMTVTYGGVSITVPQGAKDALESMNPDEEE